jgi:site-specific DNA-methyltransferase (adenine-specific)
MQGLLFQFESQTYEIGEVASELNVSEASVRNWIKTGYLILDSRKHVTAESLRRFKAEVVGSQKLVKRANKQFAKAVGSVSNSALSRSQSGCISAAYEASLAPAHKNKEGIFYTPDAIADRFFADLPNDREHLVFCDPCCGTGNFLMAAIRSGFLPENVFGFDTDIAAVAIAQDRLSQFASFSCSNIKVADFLQQGTMTDASEAKFDVIMTNPPWGKKLPKDQRAALGRRLGVGKSIDTCSLFLFAALKRLRGNGYCGMLLPESFFNVGAFEEARRHVLNMQIISVSDFGKPFKGLLTKAVGIVLRNNRVNGEEHAVICHPTKGATHSRQQDCFARNPAAIINFNTDAYQAQAIEHILRQPHATLRGRARWGLGIVTGNNARFVKDRPYPSHIPVWKGSDIRSGQLIAPSCYIPQEMSLYQQVAPLHLYNAPEKLIYKFISNKLNFFWDDSQRFVLNSANILIPNGDFNFSQKYLSEYFNSSLMNWIFSSIFATHKVLRGDIERLPLFLEFMESSDAFCEDTLISYLGIKEAENGTFRIA